MLRLAGVRINPRTNGPHRAQLSRAITLKSIADGSEKKVTLPPNPMLSWIGFSPDGKRFAFTHSATTASSCGSAIPPRDRPSRSRRRS